MMKTTGLWSAFSLHHCRKGPASWLKGCAVALTVLLQPMAVFADTEDEFASEEKLEEGFLTKYVNEAIAREMDKQDKSATNKLTDNFSAPKFGGYFVGKYSYSTEEGKESGDGFSQRFVRLYVDGKILKDFAYRIQVQTNNDKFHMKDYFLEWQKFKEFRVKIGQFKRAFTFENPMNPWDVGNGNYSQVMLKLSNSGDYPGENSSGRDQGLQVQGDLFPVGKDKHSLLHYQLMVANGQGINCADANKHKDILGTIQIQPIKGLVLGVFGWTGNFHVQRCHYRP